MADFNFVTARLATGGGINVQSDVDQLIAAGITHIIDCRAEADDSSLLSHNKAIMGYLWNGVEDDGVSKPDGWFLKSLDFALPIFAMPFSKVYTHCAAGINRGPSTAYAILLAIGLVAPLAEQIIRQARPQVGLAYKSDADRAIKTLGF